MGKDLSFIWVGDLEKPEYKHQVNWTNLECSEYEYGTNIPCPVYSKDGTVKDKYYLKKTTKEQIYAELNTALIAIYYDKEDKKDLRYEDKIKLRELEQLKKYYEKYTNKENTIIAMYVNQTSKKMKELNTNQHKLKDFDKSIISDTYDFILNDICTQIHRIEKKKIKMSEATLRKECFKNITALLKKDYTEQKSFYNQKENELKEKIKKLSKELEDTSQLNHELQQVQRIKKERNLQNYRKKAKNFLNENGLSVDDKH